MAIKESNRKSNLLKNKLLMFSLIYMMALLFIFVLKLNAALPDDNVYNYSSYDNTIANESNNYFAVPNEAGLYCVNPGASLPDGNYYNNGETWNGTDGNGITQQQAYILAYSTGNNEMDTHIKQTALWATINSNFLIPYWNTSENTAKVNYQGCAKLRERIIYNGLDVEADNNPLPLHNNKNEFRVWYANNSEYIDYDAGWMSGYNSNGTCGKYLQQEAADFDTFSNVDKTITITGNTATAVVDGTNYKIGPFKVKYPADYSKFGNLSKAELRDDNNNPIYDIGAENVKSDEWFYVTVPKSTINNVSKIRLYVEYSGIKVTNVIAKLYRYEKSGTNGISYQDLIYGDATKENVVLSTGISNDVGLTISLSGRVFLDSYVGKQTDSMLNGKYDTNGVDSLIEGMLVTLCTKDNKEVATARTGKDGTYRFDNVVSGQEYYVKFKYNGHNYQPTKYNVTNGALNSAPDLNYSTENDTERNSFNTRLVTIDANTKINGVAVDKTVNDLKPTELGNSDIYAINSYSGNNSLQYFTTTTNNINLGLVLREKSDLALRKDVDNVELSIKGYSQTYQYNSRNLDQNGVWDISARTEDVYYNTPYNRDIRKADYNYSGNDKLKAVVTYKIAVSNQSAGVICKLNALNDWYDKDYEILSASLADSNGITANLVKEGSPLVKNGYTRQIITFKENNKDVGVSIGVSKRIIIYVKVAVKEGTNGASILLDDNTNDTGKGNIAEVASYSTYYASNSQINCNKYIAGDDAGLIDRNSNPGNFDHIGNYQYQGRTIPNTPLTKNNEYEDDTDRAPFIKFQLAPNERTTSGSVWKDERTIKKGNTTVGNGIRDTGEKMVDGMTVDVQLWDSTTNKIAEVWDDNQKKHVDATTKTDKNGNYSISGFVPGNYYVKFIYPDGQNYKSTVYNYTKVNPTFSITNPDQIGDLAETTELYSDARDIYGNKTTPETRQYVNSLLPLETNATLTAYNVAQKNISMAAQTGKFGIAIEENQADTSSTTGRAYIVKNVDFGLQERPKAQLIATKEVTHVKITLANGNTLFDTAGKATNVLWLSKPATTWKDNNGNTVADNYTNNLMNIPQVRAEGQQILLTMDKELMQGSNVKVAYNIAVKNVGEVDYDDKGFYYLGEIPSNGKIVKTKVNTLVDYVGATTSESDKTSRNNLQFDASINDAGWTSLKQEDLQKLISDDATILNSAKKYNTILKYDFNKELLPALVSKDNSEVSTTLTLSQVMSTNNSSDDLAYNNLVEIVSVSNPLSRKMQYSTVGNQSPDEKAKEVDADRAQTLTVLPPFGQRSIYYIITLASMGIVALGIVLIRKFIKRK